jgi:SAM-dependent methyltransferase
MPTPTKAWDPVRYGRDAGHVPVLGRSAAAWLAPQPGERILDLGCGDGTLTAEIVAAGATVTGIDSSPAQVNAAKARGLDAREMDATRLSFDQEFDAVFSNAALHWMPDADAVIGSVARALKPGGRFVAEMGGAGNIDAVAAALKAELALRGFDAAEAWPWYFPAPEEYEAKLSAAGFTIARIDYFPRPTDIDCSLADWLKVFATTFAALLPEHERDSFFAETAARAKPRLWHGEAGGWWVDHVRLRFEARNGAA